MNPTGNDTIQEELEEEIMIEPMQEKIGIKNISDSILAETDGAHQMLIKPGQGLVITKSEWVKKYGRQIDSRVQKVWKIIPVAEVEKPSAFKMKAVGGGGQASDVDEGFLTSLDTLLEPELDLKDEAVRYVNTCDSVETLQSALTRIKDNTIVEIETKKAVIASMVSRIAQLKED